MDLFENENITSESSSAAIRKAYHKLTRIYHPNAKNGSTDKFIEIKKCYEKLILENFNKSEKNTRKDKLILKIEEYKKEYVGSEEERNEIISLYKEYKGSIVKIVNNLMFATYSDEERIRNVIEEALEDKNGEKILRYKAFKRKIPKSYITRMNKEADLAELIGKTDSKERNALFIENLEKKYLNK